METNITHVVCHLISVSSTHLLRAILLKQEGSSEVSDSFLILRVRGQVMVLAFVRVYAIYYALSGTTPRGRGKRGECGAPDATPQKETKLGHAGKTKKKKKRASTSAEDVHSSALMAAAPLHHCT